MTVYLTPESGTAFSLTDNLSSGTSTRYFPHADERGSIIAVTNGSGVLTWINRYDEYGRPQGGPTDYGITGRFGYTGQAWLPELGAWYYRNRIYNPALGRFMQTDPIGYEGGINLYAYVGGDPVNRTDPLGLCNGAIAEDGVGEVCGKRLGDVWVNFAALLGGGGGGGFSWIDAGGGGGSGGCFVAAGCIDGVRYPIDPAPLPQSNNLAQRNCSADARSLGGAIRTIARPIALGADAAALGLTGVSLLGGGLVTGTAAGYASWVGRAANGAEALGAAMEGDTWGFFGGVAGVVASEGGRFGIQTLRNTFGAARRYDDVAQQAAAVTASQISSSLVCSAASRP